MIQLIVNGESPEEEPSTSFGGWPVRGVDEDFEWPICKSCNCPMQFLGKLSVGDRIEQIFMCQNDPGLCDEWDANVEAMPLLSQRPKNLSRLRRLKEA